MNCFEVKNLILESENINPEGLSEEAREHICSCKDCRTFLDDMTSMSLLIKASDYAPVKDGVMLHDHIAKRIASGDTATRLAPKRRVFPFATLAAVAAVIAVVVVGRFPMDKLADSNAAETEAIVMDYDYAVTSLGDTEDNKDVMFAVYPGDEADDEAVVTEESAEVSAEESADESEEESAEESAVETAQQDVPTNTGVQDSVSEKKAEFKSSSGGALPAEAQNGPSENEIVVAEAEAYSLPAPKAEESNKVGGADEPANAHNGEVVDTEQAESEDAGVMIASHEQEEVAATESEQITLRMMPPPAAQAEGQAEPEVAAYDTDGFDAQSEEQETQAYDVLVQEIELLILQAKQALSGCECGNEDGRHDITREMALAVGYEAFVQWYNGAMADAESLYTVSGFNEYFEGK